MPLNYMTGQFGLVAFRSRQQAMLLQQMLTKRGVSTQIVNSPHEIALGCGISVKFNPNDVETVKQICADRNINTIIGVYLVGNNGIDLQLQYKRIEMCNPLMYN